MIHNWREQCVIVKISDPDQAHSGYMVEVETQRITIGRIEIVPNSVIGVKIVEENGGEGTIGCGVAAPMPMTDFGGILISDEPRANGPLPVVHLFNKILYGRNNPDLDNADNGEDEDDNNQDRQTSSLVRVWAELINREIDNGREDSAQLLILRANT